MRYGPFTILVILFAGLIKPVSAQQHIFKNYTVNDGLVANSVRRVFQDSKGFLWIATWEGLSKYDGHKFTNYSTANGLSHNMINDFYESPDGKLYVATNNGSIDMVNENKVLQRAVPATTTINRFFQLPGNRVIAATDNEGLLEFNNGKFNRLRKDSLLSSCFDFTALNDSVFIAVGERSIQLLNRKYELLSAINDPYPVYTEFKIYQDSKKRILVGTGTGLKLLAEIPGKGQPILFTSAPAPFNLPALQAKKVTAILEDADKVIWIGTTNGLFKINPDGSYQLIIKKDGLASDFITTIFQDMEKNIWFGTSLGLSKLVTKSNILLYTTENGLASNRVYFLHPVGNGRLLASTEKGAQVFNTANGKFDPVTTIIDMPLYSVIPNSHPPVIIGKNKMVTFDSVTLQFKNAVPFPAPFLTSPYCIARDNQGNFFLSDKFSLYFFSEKKDSPVKILENLFSVLLVDKNGDLWAATLEKGLHHIRYKYSNNKLTILANEHFLPDENIRSLFEDSRGNIWAGTRYHGVYRFSKNQTASYTISNIDQTQGLTSNWVKGLTEDANGNLWLASNQGLDKLIQQDSTYRVFNFSRVNNYFGSIAGMVPVGDHSLWLATFEGMVHITDGEMEKSLPLPVYITRVSAPDSIYSLNAGKLNLQHGHNQLQFEFSSPGFINEKQLLYSYRLAGSTNTEWTEPGNQHSVSYASLQPGNYRFEVRTIGWNGNWGKPAIFEFNINPPFWQTRWFLVICSLLLFTGIYWAFRKRIQIIRNKAAMKNKIAETEMMALRAQMNPHFIFNCINSIDALIQSNDKYNATVYLNKFAKLIRNILDSSKQNTVTLSKDLDTLKLYIELEQLRHENKFTAEIKADAALLQDDYKVPPLIIQPFVENAILHGIRYRQDNNGKIFVSVIKQDGYLRYIIEDNGVGRNTFNQVQKEKISYGIDMSNDRVKLFNNEEKASVQITDLLDNDKPAGTKVEVLLKIQ
jgi:ligand-binding sensor domain-containing protein/anti-sigma regulatory factor (Ser/Thr protein kinase)